MADFSPGLRLSDRYLLERRVGPDGVWLAHDELLGRLVAVRAVPARTARVAASVSHPHVTQVLDLGETGGEPFLVTEVVAGERLGHRLAAGALPWIEAVRAAGQVAGALAAAHAVGVVHGHLGPDSVILTPAGAKLLDVGLPPPVLPPPVLPPSVPHRSVPHQSVPHQSVPHPSVPHPSVPHPFGFVAPEVRAGDPATPAADVYALGALLLAALSGASVPSSPVLAWAFDGVPESVRALGRRCLAADPGARPSSHEAARVLRAAGRLPVPALHLPALAAARFSGRAALPPAGAARGPAACRPDVRQPDVRRPEVRQPDVRRPDVRRPRAGWRVATALTAVFMIAGVALVAVATFGVRGVAQPTVPVLAVAAPIQAHAPFVAPFEPAAAIRVVAAELAPVTVVRSAPVQPSPVVADAAPPSPAPDCRAQLRASVTQLRDDLAQLRAYLAEFRTTARPTSARAISTRPDLAQLTALLTHRSTDPAELHAAVAQLGAIPDPADASTDATLDPDLGANPAAAHPDPAHPDSDLHSDLTDLRTLLLRALRDHQPATPCRTA